MFCLRGWDVETRWAPSPARTGRESHTRAWEDVKIHGYTSAAGSWELPRLQVCTSAMSQLPSSILPFPQNRIPQPGMLRQVPHSGFPGRSGWFSSQTLGRQIQGQARLEREWAGSVPPSRHDRDRSFPTIPDPLQVPLWVPTAPPCRFQLLLPEIAPSSPLNPSFPSPGPTPWSSPTPQFPPHPSIVIPLIPGLTPALWAAAAA